MYAPKKANRGIAKGWKTLAFDQGVKEKQRERLGKDNKEGGNLQKRQTAGNIDGEEDGTEGLMIIEEEMGGHCVHRVYVDGGSSSEILADIVASKDRRRGTLNIRSDEFHGGEITLSLQRDYRKAGGKEDPSNSIHGTWND
nr:hypothetical protein [Tanacetum cinerariifolium]